MWIASLFCCLRLRKAPHIIVKRFQTHGPLAQLVEQLTLNQRVAGSSPSGITMKKSALVETNGQGFFFSAIFRTRH